ncbi:MAG: DUF92 domain-containing protein [Candidatus Eremiobacteraeota bacterium]|nr:DUF92 domain-containing protein [Candidatus Eremiobacteraeota bacterium]
MHLQILTGAILAAVAAVAAYRAGVLDRSGTAAAFFVGAATFGIGGWPAATVLLAFFIPSTILSKIGKRTKRTLADVGKSGSRDAWQVLANGGIATLAVVASARYGPVMLSAFAGALAAAAADTWGTEIGTLARSAPRSILTLRTIAAGLSGGVTLRGTLAEICGAALVALAATLVHIAPFLPVFVAGVGGALVDSILGACAQALRFCPHCRLECESNPHTCGTPTSLRRGVAWIENDAVNLAATAAGAVLAAAVFLL